MHHSRRRGFLEKFFLPLLLLRPFRCHTCSKRQYDFFWRRTGSLRRHDRPSEFLSVRNMAKRPQLIVSQWVRGQPLGYECSLCARVFTLPEDLEPKESAARLIAEFLDHIEKMHPEKK